MWVSRFVNVQLTTTRSFRGYDEKGIVLKDAKCSRKLAYHPLNWEWRPGDAAPTCAKTAKMFIHLKVSIEQQCIALAS
jgi:hypothetical protein